MQSNKKTVSWRTESHSDVAETKAFQEHLIALTERNFALTLLKELRARGGQAAVEELTEEWLNSGDGGRVYEIRAEVVDLQA
jgi:hypothetical protein